MKKILFTIIFTAFISAGLNIIAAETATRTEFLKHFDQARNAVMDKYININKPNMGAVESLYSRGTKEDVQKADAMLLELLKNPSGDMFWMYPNIAAYMLGKDKMSDEVKKAVRNAWKTYAPSRGDTENHYFIRKEMETILWENMGNICFY